MKTLARICLALMLVGLATMPAMADGATTTTEHFEGEDVPGGGWFICFTDIPWEMAETHTGTFRYHAVYHVTITPSGSYNMLWNEQDTGDSIGDTTGDEYRVNMTWHEHITGRVGETQHWSWPLSFKNVTKNRMQIHDMHYHVTVNANGEVTVVRDEWGVRCAGPDK
jgi:hypothetical protein